MGDRVRPPAAADDLLGTIGNTPLVRLNRTNPNPNVVLWAKCEWFNPAGSVKERIALAMIEAAEATGELTADKALLESSSGNTGIGLAMAAAIKGYRCVITMSRAVSVERRQLLEALGAELVLTSAEGGSDEAWEVADQMAAAEPTRYCRVEQYSSAANVQAHYDLTAEEIWRQLDGRVDTFVAGLGTTGTIVGVGRRLRELNPEVQIVAAEPQPKHQQQGLRNLDTSRVPPIWDPSVITRKLVVPDEDAYRCARALARQEGMLVGISSGTALWAAQQLVQEMESGNCVVVLPDSAFKYLSTELYPPPKQ